MSVIPSSVRQAMHAFACTVVQRYSPGGKTAAINARIGRKSNAVIIANAQRLAHKTKPTTPGVTPNLFGEGDGFA